MLYVGRHWVQGQDKMQTLSMCQIILKNDIEKEQPALFCLLLGGNVSVSVWSVGQSEINVPVFEDAPPIQTGLDTAPPHQQPQHWMHTHTRTHTHTHTRSLTQPTRHSTLFTVFCVACSQTSQLFVLVQWVHLHTTIKLWVPLQPKNKQKKSQSYKVRWPWPL